MLGISLQKHYDRVIHWFTSKMTNDLLKGVHSLFQAAKRKARGYHSRYHSSEKCPGFQRFAGKELV
ncbi:transposase [Paenibacillus chungangensis]|uniref:Transposase n=1 Tax=Paenibacillus chungangensis TaxID=696535 RepID=A0ABW3HUS6_9BACL